MFSGKLFNDELLKKMVKIGGEYEELLVKMQEENRIAVPWHYTTNSISKMYKIAEPRLSFLPYARTHINPKGFKTEETIKEIVERFKSAAKRL